jgi:hypothetical protein
MRRLVAVVMATKRRTRRPSFDATKIDRQFVAAVVAAVAASPKKQARPAKVIEDLVAKDINSTYSRVLWALRVGEHLGMLETRSIKADNSNGGPLFVVATPPRKQEGTPA